MKKKPDQKLPISSLETSPPHIPPLAFALSPLPASLLLQPLRLNRATLHWPEHETWRKAIQKIRHAWSQCRQLATRTVASFRIHLAKNFCELPLMEEERQYLLSVLTHTPDDPGFWQAVQDAESILRARENAMANPLAHSSEDLTAVFLAEEQVWNGEFFRSRLPAEWRQNAVNVLFVLQALRYSAMSRVGERSRLLQVLWEKGQTRALVAAVQEELPARWVTEAIAELEHCSSEANTPHEQRRAKRLLKAIQRARTAVGKGDVEHLPPAEKPKSRRAATARYKAVTRLVGKCRAWVEILQNKEQALQQTLQDFDESPRIKDPLRKQRIREQFRMRMKAQP